MAHGQHAQTPQLLRGVEDHRRKTAWHFGVQTNLNTSLDLVLTLHQEVQQLLCVHHGFSEVCHKTNQSRVPFVHNLRGREDIY